MQPAPKGVADLSADVSQVATPVRPESTILRRLPVPVIFLVVFGLSFTFIYRATGPIPMLTQWNQTASFDLDADIMWFRNPLSRFFPDGDFQIACDQFNGSPYDRNNRPNGGFNYVKSSYRTIEFYKFWYSSREKHPNFHDQDVLNIIKYDPFIDKLGLKMRFLSTAFFGGICQPSRDFNVVCTMHANCCIGLNRKINDLSVMLEDWKRYMALPTALKTAKMPVWRVPQNCSLKPLN